jgi:hypothetical protein
MDRARPGHGPDLGDGGAPRDARWLCGGRPSQRTNDFHEAVAHVNTAFESGYLAATGDHRWVLADDTASDAVRPSVTRISLGELSSTP